jgi:hypothetical protein
VAEEAQVDTIRKAVQSDPTLLLGCISQHFTELGFYPEEDPGGDVADIAVLAVTLQRIQVVDVEDTTCRISFLANVRFSAHVSYDDPDSAVIDSSENFYMPLHRRAGYVQDFVDIVGTATLKMDETHQTIRDVMDIAIEDEDIPVAGQPELEDEDE